MDHWSGWTFHSVEELVDALDDYTRFQGRAKVARLGENEGDGFSLEQWDIAMRRNKAIDRAMFRLRYTHWLSYRLIDAYYRAGLCNEGGGWERAMQRAGFRACPRGSTVRSYHESTFEVLLAAGHEALFTAHRIRPRRAE